MGRRLDYSKSELYTNALGRKVSWSWWLVGRWVIAIFRHKIVNMTSHRISSCLILRIPSLLLTSKCGRPVLYSHAEAKVASTVGNWHYTEKNRLRPDFFLIDIIPLYLLLSDYRVGTPNGRLQLPFTNGLSTITISRIIPITRTTKRALK